jgi:undecaprenyl-phosphate galactose phosphotransferase
MMQVSLTLQHVKFPSVYKSLKRLGDFSCSLLLIVLLSPVFLLIATAVFLADFGNPIYSHKRVGKDGKEFGCLKFRSMLKNSNHVLQQLLENDPIANREWNETRKLKNDPRITRIGNFLRKTSLDELPQLFNVLVGEMSLVGARPVTQSELDQYYSIHPNACTKYVSVLPGITGLWQISGRSDIGYPQRIELDVQYIDKKSLVFDIYILLKTPFALLSSKGAY